MPGSERRLRKPSGAVPTTCTYAPTLTSPGGGGGGGEVTVGTSAGGAVPVGDGEAAGGGAVTTMAVEVAMGKSAGRVESANAVSTSAAIPNRPATIASSHHGIYPADSKGERGESVIGCLHT